VAFTSPSYGMATFSLCTEPSGYCLSPFSFAQIAHLKSGHGIIYSVSATILIVLAALIYIGEKYFPEESNATLPESGLDEVLRNSTFLASIAPRVDLWVWGVLGAGLILQGGFAFAAFLYGLRTQRSGFLKEPFDTPRISRMIKNGLIFGLPIQVVCATVAIRNEQSS